MLSTGVISKVHDKMNLERLVSFTHQTAEKNLELIRHLGIPMMEADLSNSLGNSERERLREFLSFYSNRSDRCWRKCKVLQPRFSIPCPVR
ncbi:hypothetical protein SAMN06265218_102140 [Fodinibius sediminis]|uniref:Uncharacterized protein n=1 Tax=Fodinibius sediminis TaxID=1214077 RepID=A0A521B2S2_9BACT|nr:hypothetical protein SAMN06265218_102140 [Fodinibius sediminis]